MPAGATLENGSVSREQPGTDFHDFAKHGSSPILHSKFVPPTYKPSFSSAPVYESSLHKSSPDWDPDSHSLTSQDSGIPTVEISPPDPLLYSHQRRGDRDLILDSSEDTPATLPLDDNPCDNKAIRKSSTFPRSSYDSIRLFSPTLRLSSAAGLGVGGRALKRSDDISVSSISSLSTELSVSNEDILDFTVTSSSSAIVTLETDHSGTANFSDVTLSPSQGPPRDLRSRAGTRLGSEVPREDGRQKKLGPLSGFFSRQVYLYVHHTHLML